jgi:hypothetical protein
MGVNGLDNMYGVTALAHADTSIADVAIDHISMLAAP